MWFQLTFFPTPLWAKLHIVCVRILPIGCHTGGSFKPMLARLILSQPIMLYLWLSKVAIMVLVRGILSKREKDVMGRSHNSVIDAFAIIAVVWTSANVPKQGVFLLTSFPFNEYF